MSCKSLQVEQESFYGTFYKLNNDKHFSSSYTLELNQDGSFKLIEKHKDGQPQCSGKWTIVDDEFVLLECGEDTNPYEMISSHYMSQRGHKLKILSKNKLEYHSVVLKRKK